jgi:hypothetical protein
LTLTITGVATDQSCGHHVFSAIVYALMRCK